MKLSPIDHMIIQGLFSTQQKQSLYQVMCAVRQIGSHHMSEKENQILEVMNIVGITSQDQAQSRHLTHPQIIGILKLMNEGQKFYFAKFVSIIGLIGGPSEKEIQFINLLFSEVNIPTDI